MPPPPASIAMTPMPVSTNATNQVPLPIYLQQQLAPQAYPQQVLQEYPPQQAYPIKANFQQVNYSAAPLPSSM